MIVDSGAATDLGAEVAVAWDQDVGTPTACQGVDSYVVHITARSDGRDPSGVCNGVVIAFTGALWTVWEPTARAEHFNYRGAHEIEPMRGRRID